MRNLVRTALADTKLGRLLVGATDTGVCFLGFAEPDEGLLADLRRRRPEAALRRDEAGLADVVDQVRRYLAEPRRGLVLPLDLRGTAFQRLVWAELCRILPGETRTYTQLAASIGMPRAVRAVARANAVNPVSLAVPCHRVVGVDGGLRGYRWGLAQKRALLDAERSSGETGA